MLQHFRNVIQVNEITCVDVPFRSSAFVTIFVKDKTLAMVDEVRKLRVLSDPLTHTTMILGSSNSAITPGSPISIGTCLQI